MTNSDFEHLVQRINRYNARLIAVSKTKNEEEILKVYQRGQRAFGENKAQEMAAKAAHLPNDIEWHFIGHLQTNKIKYIAPFVSFIHSVDSLKLLQSIDKQAIRCNRTIDCLLQFFIADEETKFGLSVEEAEELLESADFKTLQNVRIVGVMGMATFTEKEEQIRKEFQSLFQIFNFLKEKYFIERPFFKEISMGMSGDYEIALAEGSTMVRIGSLIFGARE